MYNKGVLIGRFQPFHLGHMHLIKEAFSHCQDLIVVIGSMLRARSVRNPFTFEERRALILANLQAYDEKHGTHYARRTRIIGIRDYLYFEQQWLSDVQNGVEAECAPLDSVCLLGHNKDKTTYYLKKFPLWQYLEIPNFDNIDGSDIRRAFFSANGNDFPDKLLAPPSLEFLKACIQKPFYAVLREEFEYLESYKNAWKVAPYAPIFVTTDAVVIAEQHLLVIQRGNNPGKGLWALPGGFLNPDEWVVSGLLRELIEETTMAISEPQLLNALITIKPFDHPGRSQIGRVITHAGLLKLEGKRPLVQASDDAKSLCWWPLSQLSELEDKMHDDHYQIVQYFLREWP